MGEQTRAVAARRPRTGEPGSDARAFAIGVLVAAAMSAVAWGFVGLVVLR